MMDNLYNLFGGSRAIPWVNAALVFVAVMLAGSFVRWFLNVVVRRLVAKTETTLDDDILAVVLPRIKWIALLTGLYLAVQEMSDAVTSMGRSLSHWFSYANSTIIVTMAVLLSYIGIQALNLATEHLMRRQTERTGQDVNRPLFLLLKRIINITGVLIATIIVFEHLGISASSLLVFLGGSSVAVALAAQETLSNMIAGFVIMIDRPFRVGDRIKLPSGEIGDVYEIGVRSTKIMDFDANLIISPNAELIKAKLVNYAYPAKAIRVLVSVTVAFDTKIDEARRILLDLAKKNQHVLSAPAPEVFVTALGDNGVLLELHARTQEYATRFLAETAIREQLLSAFAQNGIQIPFPTRIIKVSDGKLPGRSE